MADLQGPQCRGAWILGEQLGAAGEGDGESERDTRQLVARCMQELVWVSYRYGFPEILTSRLTSDSGWGCMYRSAQMVLANALVRQCLGRTWDTTDADRLRTYQAILRHFADTPEADLSLHNLVFGAQTFHKKQPGEWVGPSSIVQVISKLVCGRVLSGLEQPVHVYLATEGVVYWDELRRGCRVAIEAYNGSARAHGKPEFALEFCPTLVTIPHRLGLDKLNSMYNSAVLATFEVPQSMGIIGGRPRASLYFVGKDGSSLFYLDPHTTQQYVPPDAYPEGQLLSSYHASSVLSLDLGALDPSMTFCFLLRDEADVASFAARVAEKRGDGADLSLLFTACDQKPVYCSAQKAASLECLDMDEFDDDRPSSPENIVVIDDEELVLM